MGIVLFGREILFTKGIVEVILEGRDTMYSFEVISSLGSQGSLLHILDVSGITNNSFVGIIDFSEIKKDSVVGINLIRQKDYITGVVPGTLELTSAYSSESNPYDPENPLHPKNIVSPFYDPSGLLVDEILKSAEYLEAVSEAQSGINSFVLFSKIYFQIYIKDPWGSLESIKNKITSLEINQDRNNIVDTFSFVSKDSDLYHKMTDTLLKGLEQISVYINGKHWLFLVEQIEGNDKHFSVWGRCVSALIMEPYYQEIDFFLESDKLASFVAEDLLAGTGLSVSWNVVDWVVPAGWSNRGTPVQCVQELAKMVGGIVRSNSEGSSITVEKIYGVRPVYVKQQTPNYHFNSNAHILNLNTDIVLGDKLNTILVSGRDSIQSNSLSMESEENCISPGDPIHIRVYPGLGPTYYQVYSSYDCVATLMNYVGRKTEDIEEIVTFVDGVGKTTKPIDHVYSIVWDGCEGSIGWVKGTSEISLSENITAVGTLKYRTAFDIWTGIRTREGHALIVMNPAEEKFFSVKVSFVSEGEEKERDAISRPFVTSIDALIEAGKSELDKSYYHKKIHSILVPLTTLDPGNIIFINHPEGKVVSNSVILSHVLSISQNEKDFVSRSKIDACEFI